jgi:ribosomal protein S18 acetylase RimI-like enzyme
MGQLIFVLVWAPPGPSERFIRGQVLTRSVARASVAVREDDIEVDAATDRDVGAILRLVEEAGWAYTRVEVERLIAAQPGGMLLIRSRGLRRGVLGCVYASAWGRLGFIGLMLVKTSLRGQGLGRRLMLEGLDHLRERGCRSTGLDAVGGAVGFYSKLGFRAAWESLRVSMDTRNDRPREPPLEVLRATDEDLPTLVAMDRRESGLDRQAILQRLASSEDCRVLMVPGREGPLAFGALRRSKGCLRLGPVVAVGGEGGEVAARSVVLAALNETYPRLMTANVPAYNTPARELFVGMGAEEHSPCVRMYLGDAGPAEAPEGVWVLGAAEKG